jgi:hypothetical protein
MKLSNTVSAEFKNTSNIPNQSFNTNQQGQMLAPGGCSCTLGCSCSCSCGATSKK